MSVLSLKTGKLWKLPVLLLVVLPLVLFVTWHAGLKIRTAWILSELADTGFPTNVVELDAYLDEPGMRNAAEIFLEAFELVEGDSDLEAILPGYGRDIEEPEYGVRWPAEISEARRDFLLLNRDALARSWEAVGLSFARYPINMDEGIEVFLPYLGQVRSFSRLLRLQMSQAAHEGDTAALMEAVAVYAALIASMEREPTLISGLVYSSVVARLMDAIERDLCILQLSDKQYKELLDAVSAERLVSTHKRNLLGEYVLIDQTYRYPDPVGWVVESLLPVDQHWAGWALGAARYSGVWELNRQRSLLEYLAYVSDFDSVDVSSLASELKSGTISPSTWFSSPEVFTSFAESSFQMEARISIFETALACYQYVSQHQRLPENLHDLVPDFLTSVPYDMYGRGIGIHLKLKRHDWGLLVYSVGVDGIDDDGRPADRSSPSDEPSGDLIFRVFEHPGGLQPGAALLQVSE